MGLSHKWLHGFGYTGLASVSPQKTLRKLSLLGLFVTMLLFYCVPPANATTYWIRHDGGTNVQCTGTTNAAYPGTGTGKPCAFNHPFQMVSYNNTWIAFTSGDTMQFADPPSNTLPYYMGEQNNGVGTDWSPFISGCPAPNSAYPAGSSCFLPVPPDNTHIIGQNAGSCHTSQHTGLVNPTILSGINGVFVGIDVQGTNNVSLSCVEITQPDNCSLAGVGSGGGCAGSANYISTAGIILEYGVAQGPRNLTMTDVGVYGTSANGVLGSHLNTLPGDVITGSDVYVMGNGSAGWNSDGGGCGTSCESVGTMNLSYLDVEGNGCLLLKPFDNTTGINGGTNAFNYCFGQNTGGYGDGFVLIAAGAFTVNITHSKFKYNTQDGFDGLHLSDDVATSPVTNISSSWSEGNGGQTFKLGSGASASAINNVSISNCHVLTQSATFPNNPNGWIVLDYGDSCRASGDQWSFQLKNGSLLDLENNSSFGYGTTMFDAGCAFLAPTCTTGGTAVTSKNNLNVGYGDPGNAGQLASGWYSGDGVLVTVTSDHILWYTMRTGCPDSTLPSDTNPVCANPLIVSGSNVDALNPNLSSGSPAIAAGVFTGNTPATDYYGNARSISPSPLPTLGAIVYTSGLPTAATPATSLTPGPYVGAQATTLSTTTPAGVICYTIDNSTPTSTTPGTCLHGTPISGSGSVAIASTLTIQALTTASGYLNSPVASYSYGISGTATPSFSGNMTFNSGSIN